MKNLVLLAIGFLSVSALADDTPKGFSCKVVAVTGSFVEQKVTAGQTLTLDLSKKSLKTVEFTENSKVVAVVTPKTSVLRQEPSNISLHSAVLYESFDQNATSLQEKYRNGVTGMDIGKSGQFWSAFLNEGHVESYDESARHVNIKIDGTVTMACTPIN